MQDFARSREKMVDTQLRPVPITDYRILAVMGAVPRERFVPEDRRDIAYLDASHRLSTTGRTLPAPAVFARLVQLAAIRSSDVILDVGCGTGYSMAVLAGLGSAVVGVDDDAALVEQANTLLADLDVGNAAALSGELAVGVPSESPFDVIMIEGAVDTIPPALFDQLRDEGRLVAMFDNGHTCTAHLFVKSGSDVADRATFNAAMPRLNLLKPVAAFAL